MYFPDPVAVEIGPLSIKWYGLAYVFSFFLVRWYGQKCIQSGYFNRISITDWDGAMGMSMIGLVMGGRLGYFILYSGETFFQDPLEILKIWHPGMAFHGALFGVFCALWWYARTHCVPWLTLLDMAAVGAPIGQFFGRIANFINQEHIGHITSMPWGVIFPSYPDAPRHPSPLYEAGLEGALLFLCLRYGMRRGYAEKPGQLSGLFLMGYGVVRMFCEFFRVPDGIFEGITLGQWYCIPWIFVGLGLYAHAKKSR
jgi:phosphatidylglycerol:prolipoprotein diacylglycerol transferase